MSQKLISEIRLMLFPAMTVDLVFFSDELHSLYYVNSHRISINFSKRL